MRQKLSRRAIFLGCFLFFLMASMFSFVSAIDCATEECAGNVSITLGNTAPTIPYVAPISAVTLTGGTAKTVYVVFNASDANGYLDLNHSTANVTLWKTGETNRSASSCVAQQNTTEVTVFNCSVSMQFYDSAGADWKVYATVKDDATSTAENTTVTFTVNALDFITQNTASVIWGAVSLGTNDEQADNTITLTNGGNQDYTVLNITGYDARNGTNVIPAENFSVDSVGGATTTQVYMVNATAVNVTSRIAGLTTHGVSVTEEIFFYLDVPNALPQGVYTQVATWKIKVA